MDSHKLCAKRLGCCLLGSAFGFLSLTFKGTALSLSVEHMHAHTNLHWKITTDIYRFTTIFYKRVRQTANLLIAFSLSKQGDEYTALSVSTKDLDKTNQNQNSQLC